LIGSEGLEPQPSIGSEGLEPQPSIGSEGLRPLASYHRIDDSQHAFRLLPTAFSRG